MPDETNYVFANPDLPAFPTPDRGDGMQWPGMTLRDYFAAAALQGLAAQCDGNGEWTWTEMGAAQTAYRTADAMLRARGGA